MITMLMATFGVGKWAARLIAFGLPVLLLVVAFFALDAWGDSRYRSGRAEESAMWKAASAVTVAKARASGDEASRKQAAVLAVEMSRVERERNRIDAAIEDGSSAIDVLFPVDGLQNH